MGGTWLPSSNTRPQIPDRTKRIEGPRCEYEHVLEEVISDFFMLKFMFKEHNFDYIFNKYLT